MFNIFSFEKLFFQELILKYLEIIELVNRYLLNLTYFVCISNNIILIYLFGYVEDHKKSIDRLEFAMC